MSSKREQEARPSAEREEEVTSETEEAPSSADSTAEMSSKAAKVVDAIDEVLEEFDAMTLSEFGFEEGEVVESDKVNEAIKEKVNGFIQKGGQ